MGATEEQKKGRQPEPEAAANLDDADRFALLLSVQREAFARDDEFVVGQRVRCRDFGEMWLPGTITELEPLKVQADGLRVSVRWDEVEVSMSPRQTHPPERIDGTCNAQVSIGQRVRCRDRGERWQYGTVTSLGPTRVRADGWRCPVRWDEVEECDDEPWPTGEEAQPPPQFAEGQRVRCRDVGERWFKGTVMSVDPVKVQPDGWACPVQWDEVEAQTGGDAVDWQHMHTRGALQSGTPSTDLDSGGPDSSGSDNEPLVVWKTRERQLRRRELDAQNEDSDDSEDITANCEGINIGQGFARRSSELCVTKESRMMRNTQPLGRLHIGGSAVHVAPISRLSATVVSSWADLAGVHADVKARSFAESAVDGEVIRAWLHGEISGVLCRARINEGLTRSKFGTVQTAREVSRTIDLFAEVGSDIGGILGGLVGGFSSISFLDTGRLCGVLEATCKVAVRNAATAHKLEGRLGNLVEEVDIDAVNLEFRRRCLQTHPQREVGSLPLYLEAHCNLEILHQCCVLASRPFGLSPPLAGFQDYNIEAALARDSSALAEAAKGMSEMDLLTHNRNTSKYLLELSGHKEVLLAALNLMRASEAYAVLDLLPSASDEEVNRAYKVAAMRCHPDKGGDAEQFKVLRGAYDRILEARGGAASKSSTRAPEPAPQRSSPTEVPAADAAKPRTQEATGSRDTGVPEEGQKERTEQGEHDEQKDAEEGREERTERDERKDGGGQNGHGEQEEQQGQEKEERDSLDKSDAESAADTASSMAKSPRAECSSETQEDREGTAAKRQAADPTAKAATPAAEMTFEERLAIVKVIPVELISQRAECALDGAEMCMKVARIASEAAVAGADGWTQIVECGNHMIQMVHCVVEASTTVGQGVSDIPTDIMPLLECVQTSSGATPAAMSATRELLRCTEVVSSRALSTMSTCNNLLARRQATVETLKKIGSLSTASRYARNTLAEIFDSLAESARDTAEAAALAAATAGDVQQCARVLADALMKMKKPQEEEEEAKKKQDAKEGSDSNGDSASEEDQPESPLERHASNHRILLKLNLQVLELQSQMRLLLKERPELLPEVTVQQRDLAFALVAEILQQARRALSHAWHESTDSDHDADGVPAWAASVEAALRFVLSASDWAGVARPSFEARALRVAALIDAEALAEMLHREVIEHLRALNPEGSDAVSTRRVASRFSAAVDALCHLGHK